MKAPEHIAEVLDDLFAANERGILVAVDHDGGCRAFSMACPYCTARLLRQAADAIESIGAPFCTSAGDATTH